MGRLLILLSLGMLGCEPMTDLDAGASDAAVGGDAERPARAPATLGPEDRPARLITPPAHDGVTALPLVMLLHGHSVDATVQDIYFGTTRYARADGFYLLLPDGTLDGGGEPHWDVLGGAVDDHAYLRALLEEAIDVLPVDRAAVYLVGHSNGAFMAYRMACDSADLVTGIVSLAGADATETCAPSEDVSVLQIHGTADDTIPFDGGSIVGLDFPDVTTTMETWAGRVGCDPTMTEPGGALDLVANLAGAETEVTRFRGGCRAGVELWTMVGAGHIPAFTVDFTPSLLSWLYANRRE